MNDNRIYVFYTSPNQKTVIVRKTLSDETHLYGKCNIEATMTAARELSDRAFKLYIRLSLHQDGYTFALSPVAIAKDTGMSDKRYREAVQELIKKGYLSQYQGHKLFYEFFEYPSLDNANHIVTESTDDPAESGESKGDCVVVVPENQGDNMHDIEEQVRHSITSETTLDNTNETTSNIIMYPSTSAKVCIQKNSMDGLSADYQEAMRQVEAIRSQQRKDSEAIVYYDDDKYLMEHPEDRPTISGKDVEDDDMPF